MAVIRKCLLKDNCPLFSKALPSVLKETAEDFLFHCPVRYLIVTESQFHSKRLGGYMSIAMYSSVSWSFLPRIKVRDKLQQESRPF